MLRKLTLIAAVAAALAMPADAMARGHGGGHHGGGHHGGGHGHGRYWHGGRWWGGYGVGPCWQMTPAGWTWICN